MFQRLSESAAQAVNLTINGEPATACAGDSVAAAVLNFGLRATRTTPVSGAARAPFCAMGVCFECLMVIDGRANQRACMTEVKEGMEIFSQVGAGELDASR